ncbi:RNA polymerase subunit sigma-24 [Luteimonas sp. 9C]|uniref:sigma factor n=1 Tax=Luteimonas sp. 9C TaxID=2653148 RepID=UPI0012F1A1DC|nr:sigma factor [Luteimonas sp. 9C]VXC21175.1 RNA polymerase subunit sigma-24 [Luteimonas sp. 9C]
MVTTRADGEADADSWETLLVAAQAGDAHAYARLLSQIGPWLRGYFRHRLPASMVDDAAQDALIALHEKRHTYRAGEPVRPWVAAIARYKWIDRLRGLRRQDEALDPDLVSTDPRGAVDAALLLDGLLATLKPAQAIAIRLVKLEGYSVVEASRMTGQSESLVKVNIHRGVAALARAVEDGRDAAIGRALEA